jgi:hypothetical protein
MKGSDWCVPQIHALNSVQSKGSLRSLSKSLSSMNSVHEHDSLLMDGRFKNGRKILSRPLTKPLRDVLPLKCMSGISIYVLYMGYLIKFILSCNSYLVFVMSGQRRQSSDVPLRTRRSGVRIPVGGKRFFSFTKRPDRLWGQISFLFNVFFSLGWSGRGVKLTRRLHLLQRLRMSGVMPLLSLFAFMAWTEETLPLLYLIINFFFFLWLDSPIWAWASSFRRGFTVTHLRHTTVGRTPLDVWSARRRDLYLTTHNKHNTRIHVPSGIFFFFCLSGVFPLSSIFVLFKSFRPSCHFTFHITVLTTNTTQTSMPPVGFEPTIPVSERPKTHALERTATGIGNY